MHVDQSASIFEIGWSVLKSDLFVLYRRHWRGKLLFSSETVSVAPNKVRAGKSSRSGGAGSLLIQECTEIEVSNPHEREDGQTEIITLKLDGSWTRAEMGT